MTALHNRVTVHVPAIGDGAHFVADDVRRLSRMYAPDGSPAVELVIDDGARVWPLIVTGSDLVFEPERASAVLDASIGYSVADMPPLVAYTEMLRDAEWCGRMGAGGGWAGLAAEAAGCPSCPPRWPARRRTSAPSSPRCPLWTSSGWPRA